MWTLDSGSVEGEEDVGRAGACERGSGTDDSASTALGWAAPAPTRACGLALKLSRRGGLWMDDDNSRQPQWR